MKNTLILIAADAPQSGKSTVATYLAQVLGNRGQYDVKRHKNRTGFNMMQA